MASSSSSSLAYGSSPVLPLIPCKLCRGEVIERTSKQPDSKGRMFYHCSSMKVDGRQCDFFHWQGSYALLLIKDCLVTRDEIPKLLLIALEDYDKAIDLLSRSIKDNKPELKQLGPNMGNLQAEMRNLQMGNLEAKMGNLQAEMGNLQAKMADMNKSMMAEKEENKKTAAELEKIRTDLPKLKGSTTVKLRNTALFVLLLVLIGWFVMGHEGEEAFRLMLNP